MAEPWIAKGFEAGTLADVTASESVLAGATFNAGLTAGALGVSMGRSGFGAGSAASGGAFG